MNETARAAIETSRKTDFPARMVIFSPQMMIFSVQMMIFLWWTLVKYDETAFGSLRMTVLFRFLARVR
jgi:hypothetical protein